MIETIKKDIIDVLEQISKFLDAKDYSNLRELSNHTIHNASIYQDPDSNQIAVATYALAKVVEHTTDSDFSSINQKFFSALQNIKKNNIDAYHKDIKSILGEISSMDSKLQIYIGEVIEHAKIKKGQKIYDHGISLSRASEILGISEWDLMNYVGRTKTIDTYHSEENVRKRLDLARNILK